MLNNQYLSNIDGAALDNLHAAYLKNPESVSPDWKIFFEGFQFGTSETFLAPDLSSRDIPPRNKNKASFQQETELFKMIDSYRTRGHLFTDTNPVRKRRTYFPPIDLEGFNFKEDDLDKVFRGGMVIGMGPSKLRDIIAFMKQTYCRSIGCEFKFIRKPEIVDWIIHRVESKQNTPNYSSKQKREILKKLNEAVLFEQFLHTRFVGQKRFSLEGMETVIPALETIATTGTEHGVEEIVIGMAHRGRLNVLGSFMHKSLTNIFAEFEGRGYSIDGFDGDVKYHMGFSSDRDIGSKRMHLSMPPNPSHLEAIDPVLEGIVRAKIDHRYKGDNHKIIPVLIHGDAAIAGQGIVYEVLQMSELDGYKTGGTIHVVMNNQIGFTTDYLDARSSTYCTDIAKVSKCPVFHVNGDDVEAVVYTLGIAVDFRQKFKRDVFIDILGYRRYGHNEGDDPRFTQPNLYKIISNHKNPRDIYVEKLLHEQVIDQEYVETIDKQYRDYFEFHLSESKKMKATALNSFFAGDWKGMRLPAEEEIFSPNYTGIAKERFLVLAEKTNHLPEELNVFNKVRKIYDTRQKMLVEKNSIDWGMGELLAYASLLTEGFDIRLSGQDVRRGTFSHRHAVLTTETPEKESYCSLSYLDKDQGTFNAYNSLLSEYGVLGFEYGYSLATPKTLTIWEAQFGDFANGAQIIIDQFLVASETKWQRMNGLMLFLPHGYEGQGPEHSSARIERFLSLCAENNLTVANCTTPANFFHLLRRQLHRSFRKPTVVFTPKSLLRHPLCVSGIEDFELKTSFNEVIDDQLALKPKDITKVIFCSGKIYYDLLTRQIEADQNDTAIIRIEQLYPLHKNKIEYILQKYSNAKRYLWVQEEPENMGPWSYMLRVFRFPGVLLEPVTRKASGTTAIGFIQKHKKEQKNIVDQAFS